MRGALKYIFLFCYRARYLMFHDPSVTREHARDAVRFSACLKTLPGVGYLAAAAAAAHGAIKAYLLVLTTCTRVQTVLLHPYTRKYCTTQSVQLYSMLQYAG
jgi:hypothetical protein